MKNVILTLITILCISVSGAVAAEKSKALVQLDNARIAIENLSGRIGDNKEAAADLEMAKTAISKGSEVSEKGRQMFGFGDMKPESEQEIKNYAEIAELSTTAAAARLEKTRAASELEALDKQLTVVKGKIKIFEDRKAELEKYKTEAARCRNELRDLEALKSENAQLTSRIERQQTEIKALTTQLEDAKKTTALRDKNEPAKPVKAVIAPSAPLSNGDVPQALKELMPVEPAPVTEIPAGAASNPAKDTQ